MMLATNILQSAFLGKNRPVAKKQFKKIVAGEKLPVGKLGPKDSKDNIELYLSLNDEAFRGTLTFHLFSQVLTSMLQGIVKQLKAKKDIRTFTNARTGHVIFFVPGFVQENGRLNMLVTSLQKTTGKATLELLFLDPEQFRQAETGEAAKQSGEIAQTNNDETTGQPV